MYVYLNRNTGVFLNPNPNLISNFTTSGAAAMAYTVFDLHRKGSTLDYPKGGTKLDLFLHILASIDIV
jgi:hypothetical protein